MWPFRKKIKAEDIYNPKLKPSKPILREVALTPGSNQCPVCGSRYIRPAGYGSRLECQDCGKVFS